ncbi:RNA polymerase sigma factor [Nocardia brasiliensis]
MTDSSLHLDRAAAEDQFERIFRRHSPAVYRYVLKSVNGNIERAEDIVQEVFTAVWIQFKRDFLSLPECSVQPFLMTIATRRVIDSFRGQRSCISVAAECDEDNISIAASRVKDSPLDLMLSGLDLEHFRNVLKKKLTGNEYDVALMAWELGLTDSEIGDNLGIVDVTVRSHKSRAKKKIEEIVDRGEHRIGSSDRNVKEVGGGFAG